MESFLYLPINETDLTIIESKLRKTGCIIALIEGDLYSAKEYLSPHHDLRKFQGILDRNVYSRLVQIGKRTPLPQHQIDDFRWAACVLAFAKLTKTTFDYGSSLYEFADTHSGTVALEDFMTFRLIDNADFAAIVDFAVGRINILPESALPKLDPDLNAPSAAQFEKKTRDFRVNYLFLLKILEISRISCSSKNKFLRFLDWMRDEFLFGAPATLWASLYFSRGCPPRTLDTLKKVSNSAWDLFLVQDWRRRALKGHGLKEPWLLLSRDKMVQSIAPKIVADTTDELIGFFVEDWGKTIGRELGNAYLESQTTLKNYKRKTDPLSDLDEITHQLTVELGF